MAINHEKICYLVGDARVLESIADTPVLPMFSPALVNFLADLSKLLLKDHRVREYKDVMSYAYWIRKASLEDTKSKYLDYQYRFGRGVAFHITPSNVPINFAVSMTSSLLAGNSCVIRVSNKQFPQVSFVCEAINELLNSTYSQLKNYFCIIRYEHDDEITEYLSSICDIRIIWGGDETIRQIRKHPIPPRSIEMTFSDRYSIAIINADEYLLQDAEEIADKFYTDTYYTDQNACSSPRLVVWMGNEIAEAKDRFWKALDRKVAAEYDMKPIQAVDKYSKFCSFAMRSDKVIIESKDNYIVRVKVDRLLETLLEEKGAGGYFFEYEAKVLDELIPVLSKKCQTISVLGIRKEEILSLVQRIGIKGVDRVVSVGNTMGLEFIWDGYKMIEAMSRYLYIGDE